MVSLETLQDKVRWVRRETLKLHKCAREVRIASCLSSVEILVALYYGQILRYDARDIHSEQRDRFIASKGHGTLSLYPILADLGFFHMEELTKIGTKDSFLGVIPDTVVPGIETINGSLGHGLGVACGVALALKRKKVNRNVFVLCGDGELNEGAVWEAVMFAAHHKLDNLMLIVDNNRISMLDYQRNILGLDPLRPKFKAFNWEAEEVDGHDVGRLCTLLDAFRDATGDGPRVLIADTQKGKGIEQLERDPLCHIKSLTDDEIDRTLSKWT